MKKQSLYAFVQNITPPLIFNAITKSSLYPSLKKYTHSLMKDEFQPTWNTIEKGPLQGKHIFVDKSGEWQKEMIQGTYDDFFFSYCDKLDLKGRVVYDIGAHVGFSSLYFAEKVKDEGSVYTFEPNPWNIDRMNTIFEGNKDIQKRIHIFPEAVSDTDGKTDFVFTDNVDGGTSSGSFIEEASTLYEKSNYESKGGFKRMIVPTVALDTFIKTNPAPFLIKLDIEGGESLALKGSEEMIRSYHPLFLIEIHSIFNMYECHRILTSHGYSIELLKQEKDGRCFVSAAYVSKK